MDVVQTGKEPIKFISSAALASSEGLLSVKYNRVQPQSPQFVSVYEGINQSVNITVTTVVVQAAPEPVIALYDFIMNTFVPEGSTRPALEPEDSEDSGNEALTAAASSSDKIKVLLKLAGVQGMPFLKPNCT